MIAIFSKEKCGLVKFFWSLKHTLKPLLAKTKSQECHQKLMPAKQKNQFLKKKQTSIYEIATTDLESMKNQLNKSVSYCCDIFVCMIDLSLCSRFISKM